MKRKGSSVRKRALMLLGALFVVALLVVAFRVAFYRQADDDERVALKREYLEGIARVTGDGLDGPNFVVILFDDLGHGDIGAYGSRAIRTPSMDRLAREGVMFRHAYSAAPYCSASRAGLLTGRYPVRAELDHVVQAPGTVRDKLIRFGGLNRRLPAEEITIAEVLSAAGYATGAFGKWHLGDRSPSLPTDMGFQRFLGLLHSNDQGTPALWREEQVVEAHPLDQTTLTRRYTEEAVAFIETNRERPFFLYLPHTFPHRPLHVAADRLGRSPAGLYGDVVEELDESVGAVVAALERFGLERHTLVVVTSDNGPWYQGSAGSTRGRKFDVFEGGMRVPFIAWWPGRVRGGRTVNHPIMGIDLFPTILALTGLPAPEDRVIDGGTLTPLLESGGPPPHGALYFHQLGELRAVRSGRYKYHDRHGVPFGNPMDWPVERVMRQGPWLFDLELDPSESYDVSDTHPTIVARLRDLLETRKLEMQDNPRGWK